MSRVLLILILFVSTSFAGSWRKNAPVPAVAAGNTLLTGLKAYWKFDETTGTRADSSGNSHPFAVTIIDASGVASATGKISNGVAYAGQAPATVDTLSVADTADLSGGDHSWTISIWVKFNTLGAGEHPVFDKDNSTNWDYDIYVSATTLNLYMDGGSGGAGSLVWGSALTTGVWYFIVAQYDAATDVMSLNVNQGTAVTTSIAGGSADTNGATYVGREGAAGINLSDATFDECAFWNVAKSTSDLNAAYGSGTPLPFASWQ